MDTNYTEPNVLRTIIRHVDTPTASNMRLATKALRKAVDRDLPQTAVQKLIRRIGNQIAGLQKPTRSLQMTVSLRKDQLIEEDWNPGEAGELRRWKLRDARAAHRLAKKFEPMAKVLGDDFVAQVLQTPQLRHSDYGTMVKWIPSEAVTAPVMHGLDEAGRPYFLLSLKGEIAGDSRSIGTAVAFSLQLEPTNPPTLSVHEIAPFWYSMSGLSNFSIAQSAEAGAKDSLGYDLMPAKVFTGLLAGERVSVEFAKTFQAPELRVWQLANRASIK